jgi:hypothetical protein
MPPAATKKAAAKKAPAKKAPASKKAAAPVEDGASARELRREENLAIGKQIVDLRDNQELSWADISDQLGIGQGKAMLLHMYASVEPSDRITARNDEELGKKIAKARESGLSWGQIMARTGLGEGKCRSLFEAASGESSMGNRIGKGGRYPSGDAPVKKATVAKKAAAKKGAAPAKAAAAKKGAAPTTALPPANTPLADYTLPQLQRRLNGTIVTINGEGGSVSRIKVKAVTRKTNDGSIVVQNSDGKSQTFLAAQVKSATKPKA